MSSSVYDNNNIELKINIILFYNCKGITCIDNNQKNPLLNHFNWFIISNDIIIANSNLDSNNNSNNNIPNDNDIINYYIKYYPDVDYDYINISIQKIDLLGNTVLPGLQDAHLHVLETGKKLCSFNCNSTKLIDLNKNLKLYSETLNNPEYLLGYNWIQDVWGRYPNKNDLNSFNIPIVLFRVCLHVCVVNDIVLQRAGIDKDTVDPVGGIIDRDEDGKYFNFHFIYSYFSPTGILREKAIDLIRSFITENMEVREKYIKAGLKLCLDNGITSVQTNDAGAWLAYKSLADKNELPCRVYLTIKASEIITHPKIIPYANETNGQLLSSHRAKLFADGALGASTAAISVPYVHRCGGQHCNKGILLYDYDAFVEEIKLEMDNGFRLEIHVIGDRAAEVTLDALEKLGNQDRPILTH